MEEPQSTILQEGQTIVAEFRVQKNMDREEARELIRANTPSNFTFQEISLAENYSGGTTHGTEEAV